MNQVKLAAGALTVDLSAGDEVSPSELAEIARDLQEWQMRQTSEVSGSYVELKPQGFIDF